MKHLHRISLLVVAAIFSLNAGVAFADGGYKFRFYSKWRVDYTDTNVGEDYFQPEGVFSKYACYAKAKIQKWNGSSWDTIYTGFNDEDGYTEYVPVQENTLYRLVQYTKFGRGDRRITVIRDDSTAWDGSIAKKYYNEYYVGSPIAGDFTVPTQYSPSSGTDNESNIAAVAGRFMERAVAMDYEDGLETRIATGTGIAECDTNKYAGYDSDMGEYQLCLINDGEKFRIGHELGHLVANPSVNDGPHDGDGSGETGPHADTGTDNRCRCLHISSTSSHCFNSREYIGKAAQEGFAHFISAAMFNTRNQNTENGGFAYYKKVRKSHFEDTGTDTTAAWGWPFPTNVTGVHVDPSDTDANTPWMETECDPDDDGTAHLGTEWDWLVFFYNLWTIGDYRFEVDDINAVWHGVSPDDNTCFCCSASVCGAAIDCGSLPFCISPYVKVEAGQSWDVLDDWIDNSTRFDNDELEHFRDVGSNAGVDY